MDKNEKLESLKTFHSLLEGKNHFEVLGIGQDADDGAIRTAYFGLLKKYGADYFNFVKDEGDRKIIDEVNRRLRQAYDAISKNSKREAYIASLNGGGDSEANQEIDIRAVFEGEQALTQARSLMDRGEFKIAIQKLEKVISIDAKSIEAKVRLEYAKYMVMDVNSEGKRNKAVVANTMSALNDALEELPNADYLRVYLAEIETLEGHPRQAVEWYRAALKINPDNIQAKRELQLKKERDQKAREEKAKAAQNPKGSEQLSLDSVKSAFSGFLEKLKNIKLK